MKHTRGSFVPPVRKASAPRTAKGAVSRFNKEENVYPNVEPSTRSGTTSPPTKPDRVHRRIKRAFRRKAYSGTFEEIALYNSPVESPLNNRLSPRNRFKSRIATVIKAGTRIDTIVLSKLDCFEHCQEYGY